MKFGKTETSGSTSSANEIWINFFSFSSRKIHKNYKNVR